MIIFNRTYIGADNFWSWIQGLSMNESKNHFYFTAIDVGKLPVSTDDSSFLLQLNISTNSLSRFLFRDGIIIYMYQRLYVIHQ